MSDTSFYRVRLFTLAAFFLSLTLILISCIQEPLADAEDITMYVKQSCGVRMTDLRVKIAKPPGGTAPVRADGTVQLHVPRDTAVRIFYNKLREDVILVGDWVYARNQVVFPVRCMEDEA